MRIFRKKWSTKRFYEQTFFEYHTQNGRTSATIIYRSFLGVNKGALKLVNPKHKNSASIQILTLSVLNFLFALPKCQVISPGIPYEYLAKTNAYINIQ